MLWQFQVHEEIASSRRTLLAMTARYRQNKSPSAVALGDQFPFKTDLSTGNASPNDPRIVIVVIIVIGEVQPVLHIGGIIAQTIHLGDIFVIISLHNKGEILFPVNLDGIVDV
jgi:hypothetical protein